MTEQTEALENIEMEFSSLLNWLTKAFHDSQVSSDPRDMHRRIGMTMDKVKQQAERIAELEAQLARAEEVIRPFSEEAEMWSPEENAGHDCGSDYSIKGECSDLTVGHLRAAAQWIKEREAK